MKNAPERTGPAPGRLSPWWTGVAAATLLFATLALFFSFHYIGNDDVPILRSFMGYEGGVPAHFHLYLHTLLARTLQGLALLFPGMAWFSIFQLLLLWFSCAVVVKSAVSCSQNQGRSGWLGLLAGLLFLGTFAAFSACRITYTTTGALAGAAAVAQLLGVDYRRGSQRQILRGMGLSIALLLCCYSLRQLNVLPPLAFWLLGLGTLWMTQFSPWVSNPQAHKPQASQQEQPAKEAILPAPGRSAKPLLLGLLICAVSFGAFAGLRAVEIKALGQEDYLAWQNARIRLFDYTLFDANTTPETLEQVGWSQAEFNLVASWYFLDENITAQAFDALYAAQPEASLSFSQKLSRVPGLVRDFWAENPAQGYACSALAALALLCLALRFLRPGKGPWLWLAALGSVLLGALLLAYLAYQGRLPLRAGLSVLFPMAAFLLCHAFACLPATPGGRPWLRIPAALLCAAVLLLAGLSMERTNRLLSAKPDPEAEARASIPADLDEYALENPDMLIICDLSLTGDHRLFPDTSQGIPPNAMFWGGWPARSPSWYRQLEAYGLDRSALTSQLFLQDNVLVAGADGQPWESLMAYVQEGAEGEVEWDFYDEYGYLYVYQLYEY